MIEDISFTSEITVELLNYSGSDATICQSAWVSSKEERIDDPSEARMRGLVRALIREKHGSPCEAGYFEFLIKAPKAVHIEAIRHRVGWSYSSISSRYREIPLLFYVPPPDRPLKKVQGFKQMRPQYEPYAFEEYKLYQEHMIIMYRSIVKGIQQLKEAGFTATEEIRWGNPDGLIWPYIARCNPRSLMHFLSLRTHDAEANHVSWPMWEIAQVAQQMEDYFAEKFPITHEAFNEYGRESP